MSSYRSPFPQSWATETIFGGFQRTKRVTDQVLVTLREIDPAQNQTSTDICKNVTNPTNNLNENA